MEVGSENIKRTTSLLTNKPEKVVDINESWKYKGKVSENHLS